MGVWEGFVLNGEMGGATNLLGLIQEINTLVEKRCHRFLVKRFGLTVPQYRLLVAAAEGKAETLGALADDLSCSRGNLTGVVDRLERDGWVTRDRDRDDRRVVRCYLTQKGKSIGEIHRVLMEEVNSMAQVWTTEEQELLHSLLSRLCHNRAGLAQAG